MPHSQGPWVWSGGALRTQDGSIVMDIQCPAYQRGDVWFIIENKADAAIIAAAPELLTWLRWALSILNTKSPCDAGCAAACSQHKANALLSRLDSDTSGGREQPPHDFDACPLPPDRCAECRAIYRKRRSDSGGPTTPEGG